MNAKGQGSLEYLLLIGGGVLVAVIIVSTILTIPNNSGQSNEYGVANAQCASYLQNGNLRCDNQTVKSGTNTYNCRWDTTTNRCGSVTGPTAQFNSPATGTHYLLVMGSFVSVPVQIGYAGFNPNAPNSMTIHCAATATPTATLNCSGTPNGTCSTNCVYLWSDSANRGTQAIQPVTLTATGGQTANATNNPSIIIDYCGDLTCQATENCTGDAVSCTSPQLCYKTPATCTNGCGYTVRPNGEQDPGRCDNSTGNCGSPNCACNGSGSCVPSGVALSACNNPAGGWQDGQTYTLTGNVSTPAGSNAPCFDLNGSGPNGVTLNCNHFTISNTNLITNPLVKITRDKVTLENCSITLAGTDGTFALDVEGANAVIKQTSIPKTVITSNDFSAETIRLAGSNAQILGGTFSNENLLVEQTSSIYGIALNAPGIIIDGAQVDSKDGTGIQVGDYNPAVNAQVKNSPSIKAKIGVSIATVSLGATISGNTITYTGPGSSSYGISTGSTATEINATLSGNNITISGSSSARGIYSTAAGVNSIGNTISVTGSAPRGIFYTANVIALAHNTIAQNTITITPTASTAHGIYLQDINYSTIGGTGAGNTITMNCTGSTGLCHGIYLTGVSGTSYSHNNTISNNIVTVNTNNAYSNGIYLYGGFNAGAPLDYVRTTTVTGNQVCVGTVRSIDVNSSNAQSASGGNTCGPSSCYQYNSGSVCSGTGWSNCTTSC